jgi:hypothetical protein
MTEKFKYMWPAIFVLAIGIFILGSYLANAPGKYVRDITRAYKGVIVNKFDRKGTQLTIRTTENQTFDVALLSGDLIKESAIGDSIEKLPRDNYVILNRNGIKTKLLYRHIPKYIRSDHRWPAEWKNKWPDGD